MALLHSLEKSPNFHAPDFSLIGIDGNNYTKEKCMGEHGLLVMFICNHCPYVIAIIDRMVRTCKTLEDQGIKCVAIMANDSNNYPADSFENMKIFAQESNIKFPYLIDETQEIAKLYGAVCTPDFFGFDSSGLLHYRGRLDSAANKPADKNTVPELLNAMLEIKETEKVSCKQVPSMGCSIKWRMPQ